MCATATASLLPAASAPERRIGMRSEVARASQNARPERRTGRRSDHPRGAARGHHLRLRAGRSDASRRDRGLGRLSPIPWHRNVKHQVTPVKSQMGRWTVSVHRVQDQCQLLPRVDDAAWQGGAIGTDLAKHSP